MGFGARVSRRLALDWLVLKIGDLLVSLDIQRTVPHIVKTPFMLLFPTGIIPCGALVFLNLFIFTKGYLT
jgi:hypothetical protein